MAPATVLYDEDCGACRWFAERLRSWDLRGRLRFVALRSAAADELLAPVPVDERLDSWHVVEPDGRVYSAGAAVPRAFRRLPGGAPLARLTEAWPATTDRAYRALAARREAIGAMLGVRACAVDPGRAHGPRT